MIDLICSIILGNKCQKGEFLFIFWRGGRQVRWRKTNGERGKEGRVSNGGRRGRSRREEDDKSGGDDWRETDRERIEERRPEKEKERSERKRLGPRVRKRERKDSRACLLVREFSRGMFGLDERDPIISTFISMFDLL